MLFAAADAATLVDYYDFAARIVLGSSLLLLLLHYLGDPILDVWFPREQCPRVRGYYDKLVMTVRIISVSPQRIREGREIEASMTTTVKTTATIQTNQTDERKGS